FSCVGFSSSATKQARGESRATTHGRTEMNGINEFALLAVVAAPVVTVLSMNFILMLLGERGTLLLPELGDFPTVPTDVRVQVAPARTGPAAGPAANEE